ncbi:MAG TPA: SLC13 family permease [Thermoanaerobaculia bacterium]|jgi:Na+/H+ antiporter NhaD/arsenite permease-like protein|nr:SLC13 family permease [Thermoanaerobaculia bacterium]
MSWREGCGLVVVAATLLGVAVGRYPWLRMNRATIALVGATLLVAMGVLPLRDAFAAVDLDTLALLLGMMVLNSNLRLAGFFGLVAQRVAAWARTPRQLLALVVAAAGVLAAVFLNDTIVLMMTPLVIEIAAAARQRPLPYLVALVTAANVGSVATEIGNPQNMLVAVASGIPFGRFTATLLPLAVVGLIVVWAVIAVVYRGDLGAAPLPPHEPPRVRPLRSLLRECGWASLLLLLAIAVRLPLPLAALLAASLLLVTRRLKPERVFREVDWSLLVFFASLFVVTAALAPLGVTPRLLEWARGFVGDGVAPLAAVSVVLSNVVSNVPAVLLLRPLVPLLAHPERAWLTVAMATTLAGNLTLLGSVANLIVAELARVRGVRLSFGEYLKAGLPVTVLTLAAGVAWLACRG